MTTAENAHTLLDVRGLEVRLRAGRGTIPIVNGVDLRLDRGEALGIVGESGSGKSVTTRALLRLLPAGAEVSGRVDFEGEDVYAKAPAQLRSWHAKEVGLIYQDPRAHVNPLRTVGDFLTEGLRNLGVPKAEAFERAEALLERVGVTRIGLRLRQYPHQLSGGLLQRVMIAAVLLMKPKLVVADEPTTALDVTVQEAVMAILDELRREDGISLIMVTHDLDLAAAVTDRIAVMRAGEFVEVCESARIHDDASHEYTRGLLAARPPITHKVERLAVYGQTASEGSAQ